MGELTMKPDLCSPGSHPHSDRPNWSPAATIEEYLDYCAEGLETYSDRRAAKLLGVPRSHVQRMRLAAGVPEDLFERLLSARRAGGLVLSLKTLAAVGKALDRGRGRGGALRMR
jgi:hypothetical protein